MTIEPRITAERPWVQWRIDHVTRTMHIELDKPREAVNTVEINSELRADLDHTGRIVGLEIQNLPLTEPPAALEHDAPQLHDGRQARRLLEEALGVPRALGGIDALSMAQLAHRVAAEVALLRLASTDLKDEIVALRRDANRHRVLRQRNDLLARGLAQRVGRLRTERDALSAMLRRMASRASWLRQGWNSAERAIKPLRTELTEARRENQRFRARNISDLEVEIESLRVQLARAVVFPEDWRKRLTDLPHIGTVMQHRLVEEIESWGRANKGQEVVSDH